MNFIDVHTHNIDSDTDITSVVNNFPNIKEPNSFFSVGIHPWYIDKSTINSEIQLLAQKLSYKNCIAIGECGLDKLSKVDFNMQIEVFKQQVQLSEKHNKPLIIHCVRAYNEIIALKKQLKPQQIWVIHGFNKSEQIALELLKSNIILSLGAYLLNNTKLQNTIAKIPIENILLETDNSSQSIKNIYNTFATIQGKDLETVKFKINQNFNRIFIT
ncbi:TatD DNase family protein [Tenacibaculum sp. 190524A02b]|uniref:TatD DNase family protein n=1 Tax=Tenacibaculum vairaonense TaxID=3137860 RepID=A0ABM9PRW5_9FLAO